MFENDWTRKIEELEAEIKDKENIIMALKYVAEERLKIIERLQASGSEEEQCS